MLKRFLILSLCIVTLVACAKRGAIGVAKLDVLNTQIERIFVATTRQKSENLYDFNGLRTSEITYGRYDISIPPTHEVGQIEWPRNAPNPATDFVIKDAELFSSVSPFKSAVRKSNRSKPNGEEVVVFIHGYNNNFAESLYRMAQISADMELKSTPILYAWPTTESTVEYLHDRDSVLFARDGLQTLLQQIANTGAKRILLVAHSIGSSLLLETLRQVSISKDQTVLNTEIGVVMISPDVDGTVFEMQLSRIKHVPEPFVIFSDDGDVALKVTSFLTGRRERLGLVTNDAFLKKHGVTVIDLSDFEDGDLLNHSVAITSPSVIAILKELPAAAEFTQRSGGNPDDLLKRVFKQN
ncbi:alpha/beta hydrolase [Amylibacter sp. SFDW26]|uniref:alpha/beta hydrolase n=1 Tax=Amylibacter sp. SFDW26 TaxID=2652722 RepID=UPI001261AB67|nr:alpha/beta hydrolase [Amylibacter sp. SFDW26]KAB7610368.1 alpha/beta hydrolase [Amylibacter sp. SFDW26]